jgi:VIT1/CCC1 family predicted Fe2+/Mn2+ transporter
MQTGWQGDGGLRERPTGELLRDLVTEAQGLVREEVRIAKAEIREEARKATKGGAEMGAGGAVLYAAVLLLGATLVLVLATFLPAWAAALIVTAVYGAVGLGVLGHGRSELKRARPARAVETLKEDGRWARETMHDIKRTRSAHT